MAEEDRVLTRADWLWQVLLEPSKTGSEGRALRTRTVIGIKECDRDALDKQGRPQLHNLKPLPWHLHRCALYTGDVPWYI